MNGFSALPRITLARLLPTPIPSLIWRKLTHLTEIDLNLICLNVHQGNWKLFGVQCHCLEFCSFSNKWVYEFFLYKCCHLVFVCLINHPYANHCEIYSIQKSMSIRKWEARSQWPRKCLTHLVSLEPTSH